ncbi:MAG: VPLPA-CTERM sorting domain-containing protein [Desulfobacteraceae bacterium]|nr:VPLPA-CTERM sorting domain-containing protein [Desulfobacteraceae bacterium]
MASIQGYFGSDDSYTDDPADANGKSVIWSEPDSTSITGNILSGSVFQLARSTNLQTIGGTGSNPIISWENTLTDIDQFRVRVFRPTFDGFLVDVSLAGGSRDFNFNDIAFDFDPGEDYIIRVDARKHRTLDNLTGFTIDQENGYWAGIINQSTSNDLAYSNPVPVPAAIWLFVSGLLGLVGLRRKQN